MDFLYKDGVGLNTNPANSYNCTCQGFYQPTFLFESQNNSEDEIEDIFLKADEKVVFPCKVKLHFPRFIVKFRNITDIEELKVTISTLEKDALLLTLIPIAFNDDLETQNQINGLFVDQNDSLRTIWDFILVSFRYYGAPVTLHKITHDAFLRLDSYYLQHASLLVEDYEAIIDIFIYCVNRNDNLRAARKLERDTPDDNTNRTDMDVVMDDNSVPRALSAQGSTSLPDLTLSYTEVLMNNWKPMIQTLMQQFAEFDNEGYDIKAVLYDIVQNSKMRYLNCKEVFLFGLEFTESPSALNWTERSVSNWKGIVLPETFEELERIPLDKPYNFLMSMDKESIDKEVNILGIEAHMFWEQENVRNDFNNFCKQWFFSDHKAYMTSPIDISKDISSPTPTMANTSNTTPTIVIVDSQQEKRRCIELGFVDKLFELWKLRKKIQEDKAEITVTGFLQRYNHEGGKAVMHKTFNFKSTYIAKVFKAKNKALTLAERTRMSLEMYNYEIALYKALLMQCEKEYDLMINVKLYHDLVIPHFSIRHGQFAAVAVTRSGANKVLKKAWEAFITKRDKFISREHAKVIQNQRKFDTQLHTAQMSAGQQIDLRIDDKLTNLNATVKSIIKDTVKNKFIKKESFVNDESNGEDESFQGEKQLSYYQPQSSKRHRQQDPIDLRSPNTPSQRKKKQDNRPFTQGVFLYIFQIK